MSHQDDGSTAKPAAGDPPRTCQVCGRSGSGEELLQWGMDRRAGQVSWTCPRCATTHLRALEAKLDPEWW
ncbi:MAG TPA: hypothetical protein VFU36_15915 [Jatrophihabitans sp.]|nr:hypothetical protein [Jatrophihabitans sp.]